MKGIYILLSIFFIVLLLTGCKEKKEGIEIVPNLDAIYLPSNEVDTPANGGKDFKVRMAKDITDAVKSLNYSTPGTEVFFPIYLRLYINENGSIDKIKDLSGTYKNVHRTDSTIIYNNGEKLYKAIASKLSNWKFEPAKKDNKDVKYRMVITFTVIKKPNGIYEHSPLFSSNHSSADENKFFKSNKGGTYGNSQPFSSSNTPGGENTFFVSVEQMPEPIGGIKGIQKRIHYPEIAKRAGIEGRVYVLAFIDDKGNVVKARVLKGIGGGCNEAALKAVEETKFTPGRQRGKAVNVQISVPVVFKLK